MKPKLEVFVLVLALAGSISPALGAETLPADVTPSCGSETLNLSQNCFNYNNSDIQHPADYEAYCGQTGPGCTECVSSPGGGTVQACYRVGDGDFVICISNQMMPWTQI
jgi:hypothetical protein